MHAQRRKTFNCLRNEKDILSIAILSKKRVSSDHFSTKLCLLGKIIIFQNDVSFGKIMTFKKSDCYYHHQFKTNFVATKLIL